MLEAVELGVQRLLERKMLKKGDWVIAIAGTTIRAGGTNLLRIIQIGRRPDPPPGMRPGAR